MLAQSESTSFLLLVREIYLIELLLGTLVLGVYAHGKARHRALAKSVSHERFHERRRIARELHDGAGHHLLAIVIHARRLSSQQPGAGPTAGTIENLAAEAQREIRRAIGRLPDPGSGQAAGPLEPAVESPQWTGPLSERVAALGANLPVTDLVVHFAAIEEERKLAPGPRHQALRIIQEAVSNAVKHGEGRIDVRIRFGDPLDITVTSRSRPPAGPREDTTGLAGKPGADGGHGLVNMRLRAAELGGALDYRRLPGGVVQVTASLPAGSSTTAPPPMTVA